MDENETRKKSVNAWVFLCLVTKRLANWGELLRVSCEFDSRRGCQKMTPQAAFSWFAAFSCFHSSALGNSFEKDCLFAFGCIPANWLRTIFPALLIKNADLLIRFFRPIFRMGLTPAKKPVCWPVPATCEAVLPGPPNPMWRAPVPLVPPRDEPNASRDWHRKRSQTSGR